MEDRVYESLVMRYAASWNAPQAAAGMIAALPPSVPTGKPTNAEFPTAASTPPVNIMTPEPPLGAAPKPRAAAAPARAASGRGDTAGSAGRRQEAGAEAAGQRRAGPACAVGRGAHS